ncbi:hypothetical protein [Streptomyces liliifuscus]|uniref:Uncharacterized protein n=1 Tax=Streptomyces liliifuscus TaxID=2797636 RepID=A0A7T7L4K9_9ACTN|nr:hypothetical protein [Streptomyces liliifuscus]QQM46371.1 hypothetical protein JEQ17_47905 [Streptomyces liliifuscus]
MMPKALLPVLADPKKIVALVDMTDINEAPDPNGSLPAAGNEPETGQPVPVPSRARNSGERTMLLSEVGAAVTTVFVMTNSVAATAVAGVVLVSLGWLLREHRP